MEEFKQIKNHESYIVSNLGNVINLETGRVLKQRFDRDQGASKLYEKS